jgi:hypothetical protein
MNRRTLPSTIGLLAMALGILAALLPGATLQIATAQSPTVAIVGDLQSELGCAGDWQPDCTETELRLRCIRRCLSGCFPGSLLGPGRIKQP